MTTARFRLHGIAGSLLAAFALPVAAAQVDVPGPAGSVAFGSSVTVLPNGNIVVVDVDSGNVVPNKGAVHLYSPSGVLISTITGTGTDDQVGNGGITVLANGNFVIVSYNWRNGGAARAGAVTWADADTGLSGTVSIDNSLVGTTEDDQVGINGVTALANGNYVVNSPSWDNGGSADAGAVTWANGGSGRVGAISIANSLIGTTTGDQVGSGQVTRLSNGNFVVSSPRWNNGAVATGVGAVTWANGGSGIVGAVSASNSLVGTATDDHVGSDLFGSTLVTPLGNGNYVVASPYWDNGATFDAGAVTWGNGNGGTVGAVGAGNSLRGTSIEDFVGTSVVLLVNGNYVVVSPQWSDAGTANVGAVTWASGAATFAATVSLSNSLIGSNDSDFVGGSGVTALSNGNYVIASPGWNNGADTDAGAVTWASGSGVTSGVVSTANSLVGAQSGDQAGSDGVTPLALNGNYVVRTSTWDDGGTADVGAVTRVDGSGPFSGVISISNSLVGPSENDHVGSEVFALGNGNYVVLSPEWDDGGTPDVGAATWGSGTAGVSGAVASSNSLVGSSEGDFTDGADVVVLDNGNYVVGTPSWDDGGDSGVGAATWGSGTVGVKGAISGANALIGGSANDGVGGSGITALSNGNYVVPARSWHNPGALSVGAVTWRTGFASSPGLISSANSLIGTAADDFQFATVFALDDGKYVVKTAVWDNVGIADAGAVSLLQGDIASSGAISGANSVRGTTVAGGFGMTFAYDAARGQLAVGRPASNLLSLFAVQGNTVFANSFE